jgi:hypothetical protein
MKAEGNADESKLKKRMDNIHKDIDIMKGDKFRLSEINFDYIRKELLTPDFMEKHTNFKSFGDMIDSSDFKIDNEIEFKDATDTVKWNNHVVNNSEFKNWNEMLRASVIERASRKLKL